MSLKYFHIFFIIVATLLCFFFGFWSLQNYFAGETIYLVYALASFVIAAGLIWYTPRVAAKLKGVGFLALALMLFKTSFVCACATCWGDPNNPASHGLVAAVLMLLSLVTVVLSGFLTLIFYYNKRSTDLTKLRG